MALVTLQRSPTPSTASTGTAKDETDFGSDDDRRLNQSLSESFFMVKGAALFLQQGSTAQGPKTHPHHKHAGDLPQHLQVMINTLRSEDRIKLAVRLESAWCDRVRYMVVVYTSGRQDTEENMLLGMDFSGTDRSCSVGMVLPLWSDTKIHLDGDGGFSVNTAGRTHIFKPVSVQAMWSALQVLHKASEVSRRYNYFPGGMALTWTGYYESCISSDQSCINEWNAMQDLETLRADSPAMFGDKERTECLIKAKLRSVMMLRDLENVTSKEIRNELEQHMSRNLREYKEFIDNEMLLILGQMDKATRIFDHLYLGSEWNASNLEELQESGVGYILNVTREIDNFFPGTFCYHNVRVYDEEATDLLAHWNETYNFIVRAKRNRSKCLVHCKMGVSRSASTVVAYAMKEFGWSLERALGFVRQRRGVARPNAGFMRQLAEYEGILDASKQRHNRLWRPDPEGERVDGAADPAHSSPLALDLGPPDPQNRVPGGVEDVERGARADAGFATPTRGAASVGELRLRLEFNAAEEEEDGGGGAKKEREGAQTNGGRSGGGGAGGGAAGGGGAGGGAGGNDVNHVCNENSNNNNHLGGVTDSVLRKQTNKPNSPSCCLHTPKPRTVPAGGQELAPSSLSDAPGPSPEASGQPLKLDLRHIKVDTVEAQGRAGQRSPGAPRDGTSVPGSRPHQETLEQLKRSGLVRRRTERLEKLSGLFQERARPREHHTPGPSPGSAETPELPCAPSDFWTSVPAPEGPGAPAPVPSPHGPALTRSSSSESVRSARARPGLVRQRAQEIEARLRLAGLTVPSGLKRSNSLARLACLTFSSEDLCSSACSSDAGTLLLPTPSPDPEGIAGPNWGTATDLHSPGGAGSRAS